MRRNGDKVKKELDGTMGNCFVQTGKKKKKKKKEELSLALESAAWSLITGHGGSRSKYIL